MLWNLGAGVRDVGLLDTWTWAQYLQDSLTHSLWSARILSFFQGGRDPRTFPWLMWEDSGWPLGEKNFSRESRKWPPQRLLVGAQDPSSWPATLSRHFLLPGSPYLVSTTCLTPPQSPWRTLQRELRQAVWLEWQKKHSRLPSPSSPQSV